MKHLLPTETINKILQYLPCLPSKTILTSFQIFCSFLGLTLSSCSLFHAPQQFEMEKMAEDVLQTKGKGVSIQILPIEEQKNR